MYIHSIDSIVSSGHSKIILSLFLTLDFTEPYRFGLSQGPSLRRATRFKRVLARTQYIMKSIN
uniref:Uncharacterized protein n=1 Tax=Strigamia maritima TaxID=126957 RepID=T1JML0_STRMM